MNELISDKEYYEKIFFYLPANEASELESKEKFKKKANEKKVTDEEIEVKDEEKTKPIPQMKYKPKPKNNLHVRPGFEGTKIIKKKRNE